MLVQGVRSRVIWTAQRRGLIRPPPENASGNYVKVVQRVPVKIVFDEPPDAPRGRDMLLVPPARLR